MLLYIPMPSISSSSSPLFPGFAECRIPLADQVEMAYIDNRDSRDHPPLVLLHGIFDNKATWFRLTTHLPGRRIIAPDLIGHGHSSKPTFAARPAHERYSPDMQVGYLAAFIAALALDDVILVGNSLGGGLALRLYLDFPALAAKVRGLVLIDAAGYPHKLPVHVRTLGSHLGKFLAHAPIHTLGANLRLVALGHLAHLPALFPRPQQNPPRTRDSRPRRARNTQRRVRLPLLSPEPHPTRRSNVPPTLWRHHLPGLGFVGAARPHLTRALGPPLRHRPAPRRPAHLPQLRTRAPPRVPRRDSRLHRAVDKRAGYYLSAYIRIDKKIALPINVRQLLSNTGV